MKMPYFKDEKRIKYATISPIAVAPKIEWDFWDFWKIDKNMSIRAFIRCIDLFYLIAAHITSKTAKDGVILYSDEYGWAKTKKFSHELSNMAKSIENDITCKIELAPYLAYFMMKTFNGRMYRPIITDISSNPEDVYELLEHTRDFKSYEKYRLYQTNKKYDDDITQLTVYSDLFN